jgi:ESS family glutamate:Na+ symporter
VEFWSASIVADGLTIVALLAVATLLSRTSRWVRRVGVPDAIVAGILGMLLGPSALDVLPSSTDGLELVIYHAFAVVFIAVGLQCSSRSRAGAGGSIRRPRRCPTSCRPRRRSPRRRRRPRPRTARSR